MQRPARQLTFAEGVLQRARAAASDARADAGDARAMAAFLDDAEAGGVTLTAEVLQCKRVPRGSGVSYGHTHVTERETTLALVDIGYGHGLPRKAGNRAGALVSVHGVLVPIVGRVAMDACVIDVGDLDVSPGDRATVFGDPATGCLSLAQWAAAVGEHPLSIVAALRTAHTADAALGIAPFVAANRARVSGAALRANVSLMRDRVAPAELIAVVKDDAYGHGLDGVVGTFRDAGVEFFGALDVSTAHRVRELAPNARVLAWVLDDVDALPRAIAEGIELGVTSELALRRVVAAAREAGRSARVHLRTDTGLHRAGVRREGWASFVADAVANPDAVSVVGLWTHIAEASDAADTAAIEQFLAAVAEAHAQGVTEPTLHLAASAAAFTRADARQDAVRIGAFLYGIAPGDGVGPAELGLRPAMSLESAINARWGRDGRAFASVQLGGVHGMLRDCVGATLAVRGTRYPIVCVEPLRTIIEVGAGGGGDSDRDSDGNVVVGDIAVFFGDGARGEATLQELADTAGTIGEEIVTRLDRVLTRVWAELPGRALG